MNPPRVLIVSPYFPPSTLAGVHRARHLAKHLPVAGWHPIVVCVDETRHEERLDPGLAELVPADLEIVKVSALPLWLTRAAGMGDLGLRSYFNLAAAIANLIETRDIKLVFFTGSPYYPMLLSRMVKQRYAKPVVLDFQDPWVSNWGKSQNSLSKVGISHALATWLEPIAVRQADFVTSVSEIQNVEFAARYPWFDPARLAALPIGGDPDDYAYLRSHRVNGGAAHLATGMINFTYVGTLLPRASRLIEVLFAAVAKLRSTDPALSARIRFNFVGTSNQPNRFDDYKVRPFAEASGISDLVSETPQRVPYLEALNLLANSDVLMLVGSDEPHYTASKIYPALLSQRPCLALFHKASSAYDILRKCGGTRVLGFETVEELAGLTDALVQSIRDLALFPESVGQASRSCMAPYEASAISRRFARIFDGLIN